jgi:hypothetical protein
MELQSVKTSRWSRSIEVLSDGSSVGNKQRFIQGKYQGDWNNIPDL